MRVVLFIVVLLQSLVFANNSDVLAIDIKKKAGDGDLKGIVKNYVFFYKTDNDFPRIRVLLDNRYKQKTIKKEIIGIGGKLFYFQSEDDKGRWYSYILTKEDIDKLLPKSSESSESLYIHDLTSMNNSNKSKEKEYGKYLKENKLQNQTSYRVYVASNNPNIDSYIPEANGTLLNSGGFTHINIIVEDNQEKILVEDTADWIIYIGHGSSFSGQLSGSATIDNASAIWDDSISPSTISWENVKGFLSFGCAIIDVGDFGNQNSLMGNTSSAKNCERGNYCKEYYIEHDPSFENSNPEKMESPNPGKKWADKMLSNEIDTILGFNFIAPNIFSGGDNLLEDFLLEWINGKEFINSWKEIRNLGIVERGYLKKSDKQIKYSFAKAFNNKETQGKLVWQKERTVEEALMFSNCFNNLHDINFNEDKVYPICRVYKHKIATGREGSIFDSKANITRAEFTKMLLIASDIQDKTKDIQNKIEEKAEELPKPFPDVEIDTWYYPYIKYAKAHQIIIGYDDGTFKPNETIPFSQASKIIVNTLIGNIVVDENIADWWTPFIEELKTKKISVYDPSYNISREEMAEIVIQILEG